MNSENIDIHKLTLEEKIGQLFFIGIPGPELDQSAIELLETVRPGGVCLFARNIKEAEQTRMLLDGLRETLPIDALLSLDQEGGLVDRLRRVVTPMPAASEVKTPEQVRQFACIVAETLRILGFNMNFTPVVDVVDDRRTAFNNGLRSRAFGNSVNTVIELAGLFLSEMQKAGCLGCIKHFPGLGAAEVDSHEELPLVSISKDEFEITDLAPYRYFLSHNRVDSVMVAHAAYPNLAILERDKNDRLLPASLSYNAITDLLRGRLDYDGVVITDDLEMGAIVKNYGIGEACKLAVNAGADMLAICAGVDNIQEGVSAITKAAESGEIPEDRINESLRRILDLKARIVQPLPFDTSRLSALSDEIAELKSSL